MHRRLRPNTSARLCEAALNQLERWIVDLNEGEGATAPRVELYEQKEVDEVKAERNEVLTKAYFMRTYNLEDRDVDVAPVAQLGSVQEGAALTAAPTSAQMVAFAESVYRGEEHLAAQTDALAQSCNKAVGVMAANHSGAG